MKFGLTAEDIEQISKIFASHSEVDEVIIYGSRAMGNFKPGSDIDLTLRGSDLNSDIIGQIRLELDDSLLPYMFDLSIFKEIRNPDLIDHIKRVGKLFYSKNKIALMASKSEVDKWLKNETSEQKTALLNASKQFEQHEILNLHILQGIYGQESRFGKLRRKRGMKGAAGDFHIEKDTATRFGLRVTKKEDDRFDVGLAAVAEVKYLNFLNGAFKKPTILDGGRKTQTVADDEERLQFILASVNGGEGRIAEAQRAAHAAGKEVSSWDQVKRFLDEAGATKKKVKEISEYPEKVIGYANEFAEKKKKHGDIPDGWHWINYHGRHILVPIQ